MPPDSIGAERATALITMGGQSQAVNLTLDALLRADQRVRLVLVLHPAWDDVRVASRRTELQAGGQALDPTRSPSENHPLRRGHPNAPRPLLDRARDGAVPLSHLWSVHACRRRHPLAGALSQLSGISPSLAILSDASSSASAWRNLAPLVATSSWVRRSEGSEGREACLD